MTPLLITIAIAALATLAWKLLRKPQAPVDLPWSPDDFPTRWEGLIHYEPHSLLRRRQRGVTDANVRDVLGNPYSVEPTYRKSEWRKELRGNTDVRTLRVIVEDWPVEKPRIITVVWVDKEIIEVPTERLGALIGTSGRTIKRIEAESGTKVLIHKDRSREKTNVTIQSPFEWDRDAAKAAIGKIVD